MSKCCIYRKLGEFKYTHIPLQKRSEAVYFNQQLNTFTHIYVQNNSYSFIDLTLRTGIDYKHRRQLSIARYKFISGFVTSRFSFNYVETYISH